MLIIFDLDDTLIDTSGFVTPFKLKESLKKLVHGGLCVSNFEEAYLQLLQMDRQMLKSSDSLHQFLMKNGGDLSLQSLALQEMSSPLPEHFQVPTTPHVKEILQWLQPLHTLVLVTGGNPPFQMEKLEKAGIDKSIFSNIAIPEDSKKLPVYKRLLQEFAFPASQVLVCGDRIAMDLLPAHELGFKTVHMRWGRGKLMETQPWVDYTISDLSELKRIIKA